MTKSKTIPLKWIILCTLIYISNINISAQSLLLEREIRFTEYPAYEGFSNSVIESQITDSFIKKNRIKVLTESFHYTYNDKMDTIIPVYKHYYDSIGKLSKREIFYYGGLAITEYFTYSANKITVHNTRFENNNMYVLSYELILDKYGNPTKYVSYDDNNNRDGLDSIIYKYSYNNRGEILSKEQQMFYGDDYTPVLIFKYSYNAQGQNSGYVVSNPKEKLYSVTKKFTGNQIKERNAQYFKIGNQLIATDLSNTESRGGKNYFDSTEYFYGQNSRIEFIKRVYIHDPLFLRNAPSSTIIQFVYDEKGFLTEKFNVTDRKKNHIIYNWEFYD